MCDLIFEIWPGKWQTEKNYEENKKVPCLSLEPTTSRFYMHAFKYLSTLP